MVGMYSSQMRSGINSEDEITIAIDFHAEDLFVENIKKAPLLCAFATIESSFGSYDVPRYEPAYGLGGLYYHRSIDLQKEYKIYGPLVSMSYGPWQIMYSTAKQVGYVGHPLDLWPCANSIPYVIDYLNLLYKRGATTVEKLAQGYNSGSVGNKPTDIVKKYIEKVLRSYEGFVLKYQKGRN